ncbi:uncharacterized protein LOC143234639 [Tachypleus tridentatus]|uniref:uncharacterized protein LOC143234639 n=1 Tax=Tachypleus tridentatus TaxID=6853 RepID=UPI003FD49782
MEEGGNHVSKHLDECGGANDARYQSSDDRITGEDVPQIKNYSKLYNNVLGNHSLLSLPKDSQTSLNQIDDDQMYQARNDQMSKNWDCEISGIKNNQRSQNQVNDVLKSQVSDDEGDDPYVLLDYQRTSSTGDSEMIPRAYNHSLNISFDECSFPICEDIKSLESTNVLSQIQEKTLSIKCLEKLGDKSKNYLYNSSQQNFDHTDVERNTEISGKNHNSKYLDDTNMYSDTEFFEENPIYSERNTNKPLLSCTSPIHNERNDVHSNQTCVSPLEVLECCSYRSPKTMENNVSSKNVVDGKESVKSKVSICPNMVDLNECCEEKQFLHSTLKVKETEKCISHNVSDSKHGDDKSQLSQELVCDDDVSSDADWLFAEELVAPLKALGNILKKSQERHSFEHKDTKVSENSKNCLGPRSELRTEGIRNASKIIFRRKRLFSSSRSNSQMTHGVSPSPRCILRDQDTQQGNNLSYHEETSGNQHVNKNVLHSQKHKHKFTRVKHFQKIRKIFDSSDSEENDHCPSKMMKKHELLWDQSVEEDCDIFQSLDEPISQELSSCTSKYIHDQKGHLDKYSIWQYEEEPDLEFNNLDDETCEEPPTCSGPITILSEESQTSGNEGDNSEAMNRVIANVQADLNCNQTSHSFKNLPEPPASREEPASLSGLSGTINIQAQNKMKKEIEQMYKKIMVLEARLLKPSKNNNEDFNQKAISNNLRAKNQTFVCSQQNLSYSQKTRRHTDDQRLALKNFGTKENVCADFTGRGNQVSNKR